MRTLELKVVYRLDLTNKIMLGPIKKQTLYERFTDGRIAGLLAEDLANALYSNLTKSPSEGSSFDIMDNDGRKYECRTFNKNGAGLLPSYQVGIGRSRNLDKHKEKLAEIYAFIFVDIRDSPIFKIVAIPTVELEERERITPRQFYDLTSRLPEQKI